ncbi:MAG: hypothetical protein KAH38_01350 [Candidatus Hydrogenedentes bacterium]|nr:hypothetical protein [Candidatus Hydrogenedentota bacterium]
MEYETYRDPVEIEQALAHKYDNIIRGIFITTTQLVQHRENDDCPSQKNTMDGKKQEENYLEPDYNVYNDLPIK